MSLANLIASVVASGAGAVANAVNNKNKGSSSSGSNKGSSSGSSGSSGGSSGSSGGSSSFDAGTDYQKLIDEAASRGDYAAAAQYEQQRNNKIDAGYGGDYQKTNNYSQYLNGGSSGGGSSGGSSGAAGGGLYQNVDLGDTFWSLISSGVTDPDYLQDIADARADKASSTAGLEQYVGDQLQHNMQGIIDQLKNKQNLLNQAQTERKDLMQQAADQQQAAIQAGVDSAIAGLNAQKDDVDKLTKANNAAAERAYMQTVNPNGSLAENLAANGLLPTGVTETSQIQAGNTYQNALNENATTQTEALAEIERAITQAQLTGDIQAAQALSDLLTQIAEQGYSHVQDILAQNQWQSQFGQNLGVTNAELTGIYNGQPTLEAQRLQADLAAAEDQRKVVQQQLELGEIDKETARKQLELLDRQIQQAEQEIQALKLQNRYYETQL